MNITVFCGARMGQDPAFRQAAADLGTWIAAHGHVLVYGGGGVGLMGAVSEAALAAGGEVVGIMPRFLVDKEMSNANLTELYVTESMAQRKAMLISRADAYIALPGGQGTYEELAQVLSLAKLEPNERPVILFNVNGFFDAFVQSYAVQVQEGFALEEELRRLHCVHGIDELGRALGTS